jgi:hypothetical protein
MRRSPASWRVDKDSATLAQLYPSLREQAMAGDASASLLLSRLLKDCQFAPEDQASLDAAIDRLMSAGEIRGADGSVLAPVRPGESAAQKVEELLMRPYRFCRGITAAQRTEEFRWFLKAVNLGHPVATASHASTHGTSNAALRLHEAAWRSGNLESALQLGRLHDLGHRGERQPDPARSMAFYYVFGKLLPFWRQSTDGETPAWVESKFAAADPAVRNEALDLAKQLLRDNPNCCYRR